MIPKWVVVSLALVLASVTVAASGCGSSEQPQGHGNEGAQGGAGGNQGEQGGQGGDGGLVFTGASSSGAGGAAGGGNGCGGPTASECVTIADCDDGNAMTTDACVTLNPGKEFETSVCVHTACTGTDCTTQSVDPTCAQGAMDVVYPPFVPIVPPTVPANCANGFELTDALGAMNYVLKSKTAAGSQGMTLNLDFATYTAPDGLIITGSDGKCPPYVLFESCRLKTADKPFSAYGNGMERPADIALRQFNLELRPGTTELTFDFSKVESPMYVRVLGLCDFNVTPAAGVAWFSLVPP